MDISLKMQLLFKVTKAQTFRRRQIVHSPLFSAEP